MKMFSRHIKIDIRRSSVAKMDRLLWKSLACVISSTLNMKQITSRKFNH